MTLRDFETDLSRHGLELLIDGLVSSYTIIDSRTKQRVSPPHSLDGIQQWWSGMKNRMMADFHTELQASRNGYTRSRSVKVMDPHIQDKLVLDTIFTINRNSVSGPLATPSMIKERTGLSGDTITHTITHLHNLRAIDASRNPDSRAPGKARLLSLTTRGQYLLYYLIVTPSQ